ncbi:hypothetical protein D6792_02770 [Candidatus Parcubacteria bacterium]|nr:MAG: hypothetical protein D6792_02770 [Candidatus Parcubacteria bacterium]
MGTCDVSRAVWRWRGALRAYQYAYPYTPFARSGARSLARCVAAAKYDARRSDGHALWGVHAMVKG